MPALLRLEDLHAGYGPITALRGLDLVVAPGELVCLIGANGAGKTSTLRAISGLLSPSQGRIVFDGREIHGREPAAILRAGIAHCPEGRRVFPYLTVEENLAMGAYVRRDRAAIADDVGEVCRHFPILAERRRQMAGTLSGGEQQMLAIARSLMSEPRLLMLDEPSLELAPLIIDRILEGIEAIEPGRHPGLLVEQNVHRAQALAPRAYVLELGAVTLTGSRPALAAREDVRRAYLGV
jgi:branched-chain amino acid transport system ATP-binding protein